MERRPRDAFEGFRMYYSIYLDGKTTSLRHLNDIISDDLVSCDGYLSIQ